MARSTRNYVAHMMPYRIDQYSTDILAKSSSDWKNVQKNDTFSHAVQMFLCICQSVSAHMIAALIAVTTSCQSSKSIKVYPLNHRVKVSLFPLYVLQIGESVIILLIITRVILDQFTRLASHSTRNYVSQTDYTSTWLWLVFNTLIFGGQHFIK